MSISGQMDKRNVVCTHTVECNDIPFKQMNETDTHNNMKESLGHDGKCKRSVTKGQIVYDACHLHEMARIGKSIETEDRLVIARGWKEGEWRAMA